ncbi:unnamed protein product [Paramecium octaurelia]|uniref:Uncharacterized protein n=1 Tax=Paramecium octaurelia TaxID=43137 RepID=A0A8S1WUL7_PAROT|nr:unnamed protein product [Paramecium octaurelia]
MRMLKIQHRVFCNSIFLGLTEILLYCLIKIIASQCQMYLYAIRALLHQNVYYQNKHYIHLLCEKLTSSMNHNYISHSCLQHQNAFQTSRCHHHYNQRVLNCVICTFV